MNFRKPTRTDDLLTVALITVGVLYILFGSVLAPTGDEAVAAASPASAAVTGAAQAQRPA